MKATFYINLACMCIMYGLAMLGMSLMEWRHTRNQAVSGSWINGVLFFLFLGNAFWVWASYQDKGE